MLIEYKNEFVILNTFNGFGLDNCHWIAEPSFEHEKKCWSFTLLSARPRTQSVWPVYLHISVLLELDGFSFQCFIDLSALPVRRAC